MKAEFNTIFLQYFTQLSVALHTLKRVLNAADYTRHLHIVGNPARIKDVVPLLMDYMDSSNFNVSIEMRRYELYFTALIDSHQIEFRVTNEGYSIVTVSSLGSINDAKSIIQVIEAHEWKPKKLVKKMSQTFVNDELTDIFEDTEL